MLSRSRVPSQASFLVILRRGLLLVLLASVAGWSQTPIVTWHYDNARTGANTSEVFLTPANVNSTTFGKLMTQPVDGLIVGHPLYLPNVSIPGAGVHSVVYVATMHDSVYAFDANAPGAPALWTTSLLSYSPAGATPVPIGVKGCSPTVKWKETGVISTPVIDAGTRTIYLVAETYENTKVVHRLHALDVTTGREQPGWPVTIAASVTQNGVQSTFVDTHQMNRPGLLLNNGHVYIAFGGSSCNGGDKGWVMSYNTSTASQEGAYDIEPGRFLASIWQKGAGISADADGNIYATSGEGPVVPGVNLGSSVFKLSQTGQTLTLADWFTPWNWSTLNTNDLDINNAVVILPDQPGAHPHEAVTFGKEGTIYVLDRDNLGHLCTTCTVTDTQIVQELPGVAKFGYTPVYWNGSLYITGSHNLQIYSLSQGQLNPGPFLTLGSITHPVVTANGNRNGIVWLVNGAVLTALNATNLQKLYTSGQAPNNRDKLPLYPHFGSPVVADGKVFFGTSNSLVVYGLLPTIVSTAGDMQTGTVAEPLPGNLRVQARDPNSGNGISGLTVTFSDSKKGGVFGSPTAVTDPSGFATTTYTLPAKAGSYTVTASTPGYQPATFTETANAGPAVALAAISGRAQTGTAGAMLPAPLVAKVRDAYGNGIPGVPVSFTDKGIGGTFSATPVATDSTGRVSVTYTAGPKTGPINIYVSAPGVPSITFGETIEAPSASISRGRGILLTGSQSKHEPPRSQAD